MTRPVDITGQKFGFLTVLKMAESDSRGQSMWLCKCDCGNTAVKKGKLLRNGETRSCGCRIGNDHSVKVGNKYWRLTVVNGPLKNEKGRKVWECVCDCGETVQVTDYRLWSRKTRSCGCLVRDLHLTHGESKTKLYHIWESMKGRCYTKGHTSFKNYGAKGITVCAEWVESYDLFKDWAIDNGYREGLQIDRINGEGEYSPNNCRFVTPRENNINKKLRRDRNHFKLIGVYKSACAKSYGRDEWYAQITINSKRVNLTGYLCPVSAAIARDLEILRIGLGYNLNFPDLANGSCEEVIRKIIYSEGLYVQK